MIEFGIFDTSAIDLPPKLSSAGVYIPDGTLVQIHERTKELFNAQVRRMVVADRVGFHTYWIDEHHFLIEGSEISPNPFLTQAAAVPLTKGLRFGQLSNILPWHHPVRLAEQLAQLDIMSGGRCEVGVGRGYQPRETELFGYSYGGSQNDQEKNYVMFEEALEILIKCWTEPSFSYHGQFFQIPPGWVRWNHPVTRALTREPNFGRTESQVFDIDPNDNTPNVLQYLQGKVLLRELSVLPQPLQKPYPQIMESLMSARSIKLAARHGFNGQFIFVNPEKLRLARDMFYEEARKAGFPDRLNRGEFKRGWDGARRRGILSTYPIHVQEKGIGNLNKAWERERAAWDHFAVFGFTGLFGKGTTFDPTIKPSIEVFKESGVFLFGSGQEIVDKLMQLHKDVFDGQDMAVCLKMEQFGASHTETEEQIQYIGEEIIPVVARACGGLAPREDSKVDFRPEINR